MTPEVNCASKFLNEHATYGEAEADSILVNIIGDVELREHLTNIDGVLQTDSVIPHFDLNQLSNRISSSLLAETKLLKDTSLNRY